MQIGDFHSQNFIFERNVQEEEPLIIQDRLFLSRRTPTDPIPVGEYVYHFEENYRNKEIHVSLKHKNIYESASKHWDIVTRLVKYIESLILDVSDQHRMNNYEGDLLKFKNNVTRMVTNEYFFFTETVLELDQFQLLQEKIFKIASQQLENLHLVLASFAVRNPEDNRIMNVVAYIECGKNPTMQFTVKNYAAQNEALYRAINSRGKVVKLYPAQVHTSDISKLKIKIHEKDHSLSYDNRMVCKTAGDKKFYSILDICIDHRDRVSKNFFYKELDARMKEGKSKEDIDKLLTAPCSHIVVSNSFPLNEKNSIGNVVHADPLLSYKTYNQQMIKNFVNSEVHFGTPTYTIDLEPQPPKILFSHVLSEYYSEREKSLEKKLDEYYFEQIQTAAFTSSNRISNEQEALDVVTGNNGIEPVIAEDPDATKECFIGDQKLSEEVNTANKPQSQLDLNNNLLHSSPERENLIDFILRSMVNYAQNVVNQCPKYFVNNPLHPINHFSQSCSSGNIVQATNLFALPSLSSNFQNLMPSCPIINNVSFG